jgi:hypothetical protein
MKDNTFKKIKEIIKYKKALNQLDKLEKKDNKQYEKDRKAFERNANKAAKTIINNDIKKGNDDPFSNG